jgi:ribonuclease G
VRKELLINAAPPETRAALLEDGQAVEVFHERRGRQPLVGNVYLGRVHRVLTGMQAAFVSLGMERDAFLYVEDAVPHPVDLEMAEAVEEPEGEPPSGAARHRIDDFVKEGQEIVVQVTKDPLAGKGPRVTSSLSLAGRLLVYLPAVAQIGISRRITEEAERERLRAILEGFGGPGGFIARTAASGATVAELEADRRYLQDLSERIARRAQSAAAPTILQRELELPLRLARDLTVSDFDAIRVDDRETYARLAEFLGTVAPSLLPRLQLDEDPEPLFDRFGVEAEIESALKSRVPLQSGGSIVIHQTEALVAIDVNTGRYVGKEDLEETVFAINCEAIPEVARQMRLRDLGGLLVVDFIDMQDPEHRRQVFERFAAELSRDRARTRILQISEFGLVEVTRQRSRGNLERTLTRSCPDCGGSGRVKTDLTAALDLRRALLKTPALFATGETVRVRVPPSVARLIVEGESSALTDVEERFGVRVELIPDETLPPGGFSVE